jgi:hypothetical protein
MEVRGIMDGYDSDATGFEAYSHNFFDYDLTINAALVANENATVFTRFAFDKTVDGSGKISDSAAIDGVDTSTGNVEAVDATLTLERAYLNYKFAPFAQINTGLMGGGQWATTFGDREVNIMRVQLIGALSEDMIFILTYQKDNENGMAADVTLNENEDQTTYYASAKLKFGGITLLPLLTYVTKGAGYGTVTTADDYDMSVMAFTLGANGDLGMIGFEFEGVVKSTDTDGAYDDAEAVVPAAAWAAYKAANGLYEGIQYGAYINVFAKIAEGTKVGVAAAYASSDEDAGLLEMGDDFDFTMIADDLVLGDTFAVAGVTFGGMRGMMAGKLYAEAAVMEKLTVGGCFAYGQSTNTDMSDVTFWEIDASATYAFDAAASYSIEAGYASITDNVPTEVTDTQYRVLHKFAIKF